MLQTPRMVRIFVDRYPLVGPLMWILSVQYFITQLVVAAAWKTPFSLARNTISDLGNSVCGQYQSRYVCSPLHNSMNASFISLGVFMAVGALLIYQEFRESRLSLIGFSCLAGAGIGTLLVGLFPENTTITLHVIGAALPFVLGNIGMLLLGLSLQLPHWLQRYMILLGTIALGALVLFLSHHYLGIGEGGMERLVAYPQTVWLVLFGLYTSSNHYQSARLRRTAS